MAQRKRSSGPARAPGNTLRHPLQVRILAACVQRERTPKEFAIQEGIPVANVGYHFRALEKAGYLRVARKEQARGSRRHFYVADRQGVITDEEFAQMTANEQNGVSEATLRDFLGRCREALEAGTLDARSDSHLTWTPFRLDEKGWSDLMGVLARSFDRSFEIQAEALDRLRESGESPIHTTIALAGFESPPEGAPTGEAAEDS